MERWTRLNEALTTLFEKNETYHDHKEIVAWQALAIYLAFSLIFMNWLHSNLPDFTAFSGWWFIVVIGIAFFPAFFFVRQQVYLKAFSALKSEKYRELMYRLPEPTSEEIRMALANIENIEEGMCPYQKRRIFRSRGRPGIWALISMSLFFVAQIAFLICSMKEICATR